MFQQVSTRITIYAVTVLVLALTADEEAYGDENGMAWLIKKHRDLIDAEYCINVDSGDFQTKEGKPYVATVAAGEKKETVLELEARNRPARIMRSTN